MRGNAAFDELRNAGFKARVGPLRMAFVPGPESSPTAIAYAINRKVGGAVVRNRLRRQLRALCADEQTPLSGGKYLISVSPEITRLSFAELRSTVNAASAQIVRKAQS